MGTLYESIKSLCDEEGIKPGKMCVDLEISKSMMTKLKNGTKKDIQTDTAQKIADYFGVSVDRVLGSEQKENPTSQKADEVIDIDAFIDSLTTAELIEYMGKVAAKLKERGLE